MAKERFTEDVQTMTASELYDEHSTIQRMFDEGTEGDATACFMRMFEIEDEFDRRLGRQSVPSEDSFGR